MPRTLPFGLGLMHVPPPPAHQTAERHRGVERWELFKGQVLRLQEGQAVVKLQHMKSNTSRMEVAVDLCLGLECDTACVKLHVVHMSQTLIKDEEGGIENADDVFRYFQVHHRACS